MPLPTDPFQPALCAQCGGSIHLIGKDWACGQCGMPVALWDACQQADVDRQRKFAQLPAAAVYAGLTESPPVAVADEPQSAPAPQQHVNDHRGRRSRRD